jgi:hypothetical protein
MSDVRVWQNDMVSERHSQMFGKAVTRLLAPGIDGLPRLEPSLTSDSEGP